MLYRKSLSIVAVGALTVGAWGCSFDKEDELASIVLEDSKTVALREFCKRYDLQEDKVMALDCFYGIGQDNIAVFTGVNDRYEAAVFVCDTMANEALYSNFSQIKFSGEAEFQMPYGEKMTLAFFAFQAGSFAFDGTNVAGVCRGIYGEPGSMSTSAYVHYRLFYIDGTMTVVELPKTVENVNDSEEVRRWYNGGSIFYFRRNYDDPALMLLTCFDNKGNLLYEAPYPYFCQTSNDYDLFRAEIIQPLSDSGCLGVFYRGGYLSIISADIENHALLWHKDHIAIDSYDYKDSDRVSLTNQSFADDTLTFTVEVTTYSGASKSYVVAVSTSGTVSFPAHTD